MTPDRTGTYVLQRPDGRVRRLRVRRINGDLYAIHGWGLVATPVDLDAGRWVGAA